jgi:hypothetical protein
MSAIRPTDSDAVSIELVPVSAARELSHRTGLSLRPARKVMDDFVAGVPYAREIVNSWRFRFPVREVTPDEFRAMQERSAVYCG